MYHSFLQYAANPINKSVRSKSVNCELAVAAQEVIIYLGSDTQGVAFIESKFAVVCFLFALDSG